MITLLAAQKTVIWDILSRSHRSPDKLRCPLWYPLLQFTSGNSLYAQHISITYAYGLFAVSCSRCCATCVISYWYLFVGLIIATCSLDLFLSRKRYIFNCQMFYYDLFSRLVNVNCYYWGLMMQTSLEIFSCNLSLMPIPRTQAICPINFRRLGQL